MRKNGKKTIQQPKVMHTDTPIVAGYCEQFFDEEDPVDFYRQLFPAGLLGDRLVEEGPPYLYRGIFIDLYPDETHNRINYFAADMRQLRQAMAEHREVIVAPCVYWGSLRLNVNARFITSFVLDLDGITDEKYIRALFFQVENGRFPRPSYVVASGSGMHLYWMLEAPVPCFPQNIKEINKIHRKIVKTLWIPTLTAEEKPQYESGFQAYRAVGCRTKSGGTVRAFRTTGEVLRYGYEDIARCFGVEPWKPDPSRLIRARLQYGEEWYQRRVVEHEPRRQYIVNRGLYDWWRKCLPEAAVYHHRYWCVWCLVVMAVKSGIPFDVVERDAYEYLPLLATLSEDDPFTDADIEAALSAYDDPKTPFYTKKYLETVTGYQFPTARRNGRTREEHLKRARKLVEHPGRPDKEADVVYWKMSHPTGSKTQCARETGLDRKTVRKHWDAAPQPIDSGKSIRSLADLGEYLQGMSQEEFRLFVEQHGEEVNEYLNKLGTAPAADPDGRDDKSKGE